MASMVGSTDGRKGGNKRAAGQTDEERSVVAMIAAAGRPLTKDMDITELGAIDLLHRQAARAKWLSIVLVCNDDTWIMPSVPVDDAIQRIRKHGGAIGLVGVTIVNRRFQILKRPLKMGAEVNAKLDKAGDVAADRLLEVLENFAAKNEVAK